LFGVSTASAQEWASKMFEIKSHDFGTVARSAKTEFEFAFTNLYVEDVHVSGVRSSCGCTTPSVVTPTVKTYEKGVIKAVFNSHLFLGQKGATLTVTFDKPFYAEVQLQVRGYIRGDVAITPGSVQMGNVEEGQPAQKVVTVNHSGNNAWQVTGVKTNNPHLTAQAVPAAGNFGSANYNLVVHLDPKAPAGYFRDNVMLMTNDAQQIPVLVEGRVVSGITVSPNSLFMGNLQRGQTATKQIVIQGSQPFKIRAITCDDPNFSFKINPNAEAKTVHVVPVTYVAGAGQGKVVKSIQIETDMSAPSQVSAYAVITPESVSQK